MPRVFKKADYGDEDLPFIKTQIKVEEVSDTDNDDADTITTTSTQEMALPNSYSHSYQQKKNIAHTIIDIALLSSNVRQLRDIMQVSTSHPYYYFSITTITFSIVLQFFVGIGLIVASQGHNRGGKKMFNSPGRLNDLILVGAFLITITNMLIVSFSPIGTTVKNQSLAGHK